MVSVRTGFQPTSAATVRRADYDLVRRVAELERIVAVLAAELTVSNYASFTFNAATTEPPIGNQIRINNASQTAATRLWVSHTTTDGLDVHVGLARITAGSWIYFQDFDDSTKWVRYLVTSNTMDAGYHDYVITYDAGPANVPFQKVALRVIFPGVT